MSIKRTTKNKKNMIIGAAVAVIALLLASSSLIAELQWFNEVGYTRTFLTRAMAVVALTVPIFLILFIISFLYFKGITKKYDSAVYPPKPAKEIAARNMTFNLAAGVFFLFISVNIALNYWYVILQFLNSVDFNIADPIFGMDVSFYVFKLPLLNLLISVSRTIIVVIGIITVAVYLVISASSSLGRLDLRDVKGNFEVMKTGFIQFAGKPLAVLAAIFLVLTSVDYYLASFDIMYSPRGVVFGPGYTDVKVEVPFLYILAGLSLLSAAVVAYGVIKKNAKFILVPIAAIFVMNVIEGIAIIGVQSVAVTPNELEKERPYISNNIEMTRKAFGLDKIEIRTFDANKTLTKDTLEQNRDVVDSIKINSYDQTLKFIQQTQVIRYYYDFNDVDIDRYTINGEKKQVFLSAREIDTSIIDPATWQNKHLFYTHGYGVIMSDASTVTSQGQPSFLMKDIPTTNSTDIPIENPRLYFGELTSDYTIVNTDIEEFDYPKGGENETYRYTGDSGVKLGFLNKVLYSIVEQEPKILISSIVNSDSRILRRRNIVDRVSAIAPFLAYDEDPYLVIADSKLYWIMDAYTTSSRFPYAQTFDGYNYIRNSVKVTVDAYTGEVNFYLSDKNDPIALSFNKIFGGLFQDMSLMPESIKVHIKYPENLFEYQAVVMERYHVTDPNVFYNGEDIWERSKSTKTVVDEKSVSDAYSLFTRFPGEDELELIFTDYYTIKGKENMVAIVSARMDGENYGKIVEFKFPPQKTVSSPYLFRNKLNQDTTISKELSLLDARGSAVNFGDIVITPINDSLLYVVPLYLVAEGENSIPEVKRVIVSNDDRIVIAESLDKGLEDLFGYGPGGETPGEPGEPGEVPGDLVQQALQLYEAALEAQRAGNWAEYGRLIEELGKVIEGLQN
ncbi:UPF0182 family protein [Youngiibacter multivorans]|uniref:UPF0182 protein J2Z34_002092 n=1 Tax=Youngiibacter multivorans TaxID=937251 RepID=A0ABS4G4W4_9CLOT|nr:UPF0182 family protein [Youngiibacter multivorans]MBP1919602.1 uncharacterized membrane protein (UPF0182 family) [Youngiibacter multivorans]